ncbi:HNH endonuclease [Nocardia thailandica]|uniref:HNH endonuclease n=1 Tax=Nocardia thailandica TaxID=257275 RepID=A0ABW6PWW6_9NOCA
MKRRNTGPSAEVIEMVRRRADNRCERCAWLLHAGGQIHHRVPRGMGGSRSAWINRPPNLVLLCPTCHAWAESYRASAMETGWLVLRRHDPAEVPVESLVHGRVLLHDNGSVSAVPKQKEATA